MKGKHKRTRQYFLILPFSLLLFTYVPQLTGLGISAAQAQQAMPAAVRQGYTLLQKGWVNDAIAAFRKALQTYPQSLDAKIGLANAYQRAGKDAEAWNAYQQVLAQSPKNQAALKAVGMYGAYRQEWQAKGIQALTTLLEITPNDKEARAQRALLLGYQGRYSESLAEYQKVLPNNPSPDTLLGAAQIYTYSGDYKRGLELFNRYRATGKQISKYQLSAYALALRQTGNAAQAVQVLKTELGKLKADDPVAVEIRAALAEAYQANQQTSEALAVLQPLRSNKNATLPLARSLSQIGRTSQRGDLYAQAITLYRQILAQTPNPSFAFVTEVADVMSESPADQAEALRLYQQLLQQQPNNRSLLIKQLALASQLNVLSSEELRQQLSQVLEPPPTEPAELRAIAQVLQQLDPPDPELLPVYQTLLASGADEPFLNFRVAQIYLQQNQLAEAKQALEAYAATASGSQNLGTQLLLADIERREGNLDASAARYEAVIERQDASSTVVNDALRALVGIRLVQNRSEEAIALYDQLLARNPQDLVSQLGRASIGYQVGRVTEEEAEGILNKWLQSQPATNTPPELFSLVAILPAEPEREQLYNDLLKVEPDNQALQFRLVQVLAKRDPEAAKEQVAQFIARNPDNIGAYFVQGELGQTLEDFELSTKAYQEILARQPQNTDALLALAGVRFQQRQFAQAKELYQQVLAVKPKDLVALSSLAELSLAQDQPLEAIQRFKQLQAQTSDQAVSQRIQRLQVDWLKRRSFQPYWERY